MRDVDAAEEWLDSWAAGVNAQAERAVQLGRQIAALTAAAEGADGAIKVTVGSSGQLDALDLDNRVQRLSGHELSRQIMAVMHVAQARLSEQAADQVRLTVGADTETGRAVIQSFAQRFPGLPTDEQTGGVRR